MSTDPRAALDRLVAALEAHLVAAQQRRGERDPAVEAAYRTLADAFETYDEALYDAYDEITPFVLYDEVEDEREDSELDELDEDEELDEEDELGEDEDVLGEVEDLEDVEGDHDDEAAADPDDYEFEPRRPSDTSSRA
jgi:hypothetical protein